MNPLKKLHKGEAPSALDGLSGEHELIASGTPSQQAQALLVRALTSDNPADCRPLIELALETDPDNIEALFALAQVSGSVEESKSLLERAAEITVQRIGPTALNAPDATFAESRDGQSYLAILLCLGTFLWATGDRAAAIGCGVEALRLDPLDNQLARVNLVSWMIAVGDDERAGQLFATYPVTPSSSWRYSRALWLYRAEGPSPQALEVLVEAMVMNPGTFVALATSALPFDIDALGPGMLLEIESATYYTTASVAWIESEGALDWLASLVEGDTGSDLPGIPKFSGLASQRGRRQMGRAGKVTAKRSPKTAKPAPDQGLAQVGAEADLAATTRREIDDACRSSRHHSDCDGVG